MRLWTSSSREAAERPKTAALVPSAIAMPTAYQAAERSQPGVSSSTTAGGRPTSSLSCAATDPAPDADAGTEPEPVPGPEPDPDGSSAVAGGGSAVACLSSPPGAAPGLFAARLLHPAMSASVFCLYSALGFASFR